MEKKNSGTLSVDLEQALHSVKPRLGSKIFKDYQQMTKVVPSKSIECWKFQYTCKGL